MSKKLSSKLHQTSILEQFPRPKFSPTHQPFGKKKAKQHQHQHSYSIFSKPAVDTFCVVRFGKGCLDAKGCVFGEASFHQLAVYLPGFACLEFWAKRSELAERLVERHLMGILDGHLIAGDGEFGGFSVGQGVF